MCDCVCARAILTWTVLWHRQRQHRIHRDRLPARWKADLTGIRAGPADSMLQVSSLRSPFCDWFRRFPSRP
eukprot:2293233-Rhodomonas_salina.1